MPETSLIIEKIRDLYSSKLVARKIFDYWAQRRQDRQESLLTRTADEAKVDEEEAKNFFRELEAIGLGRYIKRSRGGQARFEWGIGEEYDYTYSLIAVARTAQGKNESLEFYDSYVNESHEDEEDAQDGPNQVVSIKADIGTMSIYLDLPSNFDPDDDLEELIALIRTLVKQRFKRR